MAAAELDEVRVPDLGHPGLAAIEGEVLAEKAQAPNDPGPGRLKDRSAARSSAGIVHPASPCPIWRIVGSDLFCLLRAHGQCVASMTFAHRFELRAGGGIRHRIIAWSKARNSNDGEFPGRLLREQRGTGARIQPILDEIGAELTISNPRTEEEVAAAGRNADAMILHGSIPVTREIVAELHRCKAICRTGVGVDRMDLAAAAERDIVISNAAGSNAIEVAEQTIGLLIALQRRLYRMDQYVRAGRWGRHSAELHEYRGTVHRIAGQTLGIVGWVTWGNRSCRGPRALDSACRPPTRFSIPRSPIASACPWSRSTT